jgi:hypothetical protein
MRARPLRSAAIPFVASLFLLFAGAGVTISSPALECAGGNCLQVGSGPALCSSECGSDDDCENRAAGNNASCRNGFKCTPATALGMYACRRLCICLDALPSPPACEAPL